VILPSNFFAIWTAFSKACSEDSDPSRGTKIFSKSDMNMQLYYSSELLDMFLLTKKTMKKGESNWRILEMSLFLQRTAII
jgi:hypothetical protein